MPRYVLVVPAYRVRLGQLHLFGFGEYIMNQVIFSLLGHEIAC